MWNVNLENEEEYNDVIEEEDHNDVIEEEYNWLLSQDGFEEEPVLSDYDHEPNMEYNISEKSPFLLEYVRKNNRDKKGVLMAIKHDDKAVIGWSLCKPLDIFDKYFGQEIAHDRGYKKFFDDCHFEDIPPSILPQLDRFVERCKKYFKDCEFPAWTI